MRLMPLTADNERVRSAARAFAAGEMARTEYRRIRREAIRRFVDGTPSDVSSPLGSLDDTQRRWVAGEVDAPLAPPRRRLWMLYVGSAALVAAALALL